MQLVRDVNFASAYSFKYSPRQGTPAAAMMGQVSERGKGRAPCAPSKPAERPTDAFNASQIGCVLPVLVTGEGRRPGQKHGRSPYLQSVHSMDTNAQNGDIVERSASCVIANSLTWRTSGVHARMTETSRTIALGENAAQPCSAHCTATSRKFRKRFAIRMRHAAAAYRLTFDAQGDKIIITSRPGLTRCGFHARQRIIDALLELSRTARAVFAKAKCSPRSRFGRPKANGFQVRCTCRSSAASTLRTPRQGALSKRREYRSHLRRRSRWHRQTFLAAVAAGRSFETRAGRSHHRQRARPSEAGRSLAICRAISPKVDPYLDADLGRLPFADERERSPPAASAASSKSRRA